MNLIEISAKSKVIVSMLEMLLLEERKNSRLPLEEDLNDIMRCLRTIERHTISDVVMDYYISNGRDEKTLQGLETILLSPIIREFYESEIHDNDLENKLGKQKQWGKREYCISSVIDLVETIYNAFENVQELHNENAFENDWNGLRLDLIENGFIQKANEKLFNMALNFKVYPKNRQRIVWKEDRREAAIFCTRLSMEKSEFNKCFQFPDNGRPLHQTDFIGLLADSEYKIHELLTKHGK